MDITYSTHVMCNPAVSKWASYKGQLCGTPLLLISKDLFICPLRQQHIDHALQKKDKFQSWKPLQFPIY